MEPAAYKRKIHHPLKAPSEAELLTRFQVQAELQIGRGTVYRMIKRGELNPVKIGPAGVRFRRSEIEQIKAGVAA